MFKRLLSAALPDRRQHCVFAPPKDPEHWTPVAVSRWFCQHRLVPLLTPINSPVLMATFQLSLTAECRRLMTTLYTGRYRVRFRGRKFLSCTVHIGSNDINVLYSAPFRQCTVHTAHCTLHIAHHMQSSCQSVSIPAPWPHVYDRPKGEEEEECHCCPLRCVRSIWGSIVCLRSVVSAALWVFVFLTPYNFLIYIFSFFIFHSSSYYSPVATFLPTSFLSWLR